MWVTKLLISPVKKRIFCPKRPNLAQNWHFWSIWARPCRLILCPVGGSVGGCGARAVSRKTPIYFISVASLCSINKKALPWTWWCHFVQTSINLILFHALAKYVHKYLQPDSLTGQKKKYLRSTVCTVQKSVPCEEKVAGECLYFIKVSQLLSLNFVSANICPNFRRQARFISLKTAG